jgi:GNAT superfamily N-acetyltransferase
MEHFSAIQGIPSAKIIRLSPEHVIKPFDCGKEDLNEFLIKDSFFYLKYRLLVTYILETPEKTIAYFSLGNDQLRVNHTNDKVVKHTLRKKVKDAGKYKLFDLNGFPAVKIGRLAVDKDFQSKGIGTELVEAIKYSFINDNKTGCTFVTVDAINELRCLKFYEENDFLLLTETDQNESSRLMYYCLI